MKLISLTGAESVVHPTHGAAAVGPDGVFDVGPELGTELLKQAGSWITEDERIARRARAELAELSDPHKAPEVLRQLRQRIADLEAQLAAVEDKLGIGKPRRA